MDPRWTPLIGAPLALVGHVLVPFSEPRIVLVSVLGGFFGTGHSVSSLE